MTAVQISNHVEEWHVTGDDGQIECDWESDCPYLPTATAEGAT